MVKVSGGRVAVGVDDYVVDLQGVAGGACEIGNGAVEVGLRLQFAPAGGEKFGLTLQNQIQRSNSTFESPLFAFVKLFGGTARGNRRIQPGFSRTQRLQSISDLRFDNLFGLRPSIFETLAFC